MPSAIGVWSLLVAAIGAWSLLAVTIGAWTLLFARFWSVDTPVREAQEPGHSCPRIFGAWTLLSAMPRSGHSWPGDIAKLNHRLMAGNPPGSGNGLGTRGDNRTVSVKTQTAMPKGCHPGFRANGRSRTVRFRGARAIHPEGMPAIVRGLREARAQPPDNGRKPPTPDNGRKPPDPGRGRSHGRSLMTARRRGRETIWNRNTEVD